MEVISSVPITLDERLGFGRELRIPASWEEFLDMLEECEYRIEYDEGEIISYMGYATEEHETLVGEIIRLLGNLLSDMACRVNGSNLALHIPGFVNRQYNADCAVVQGASEKVILRGDMTAVANPVLIVEVLSPSNRDYDLSRKFKNYKKIPALQQVLFIESTEKKVISHFRQDDWAPQVFDLDQKEVPVLNAGTISIEELYRKVAIG